MFINQKFFVVFLLFFLSGPCSKPAVINVGPVTDTDFRQMAETEYWNNTALHMSQRTCKGLTGTMDVINRKFILDPPNGFQAVNVFPVEISNPRNGVFTFTCHNEVLVIWRDPDFSKKIEARVAELKSNQ